jgi:molybdate transport system regulatory protein
MTRKRRDTADTVTHRAITLRIVIGDRAALDPERADLLQAIVEQGSVQAAGRRIGLSYHRVQDVVATLNEDFAEPLVEPTTPGPGGGGAGLTPFGREVLDTYRAAEADAEEAAGARIAWLRKKLAR